MNAIVSVVGKNTVGILAAVSSECAKYNADIVDVSQTIANALSNTSSSTSSILPIKDNAST